LSIQPDDRHLPIALINRQSQIAIHQSPIPQSTLINRDDCPTGDLGLEIEDCRFNPTTDISQSPIINRQSQIANRQSPIPQSTLINRQSTNQQSAVTNRQ
jgi:hypothetical protein